MHPWRSPLCYLYYSQIMFVMSTTVVCWAAMSVPLSSVEKKKIRVLNMNQKQVLQRYKRMKQRKALLQSNPRQSLQAKQDASCSSSLASQRANNDYLARCQQQFRHKYTLPPGVNSDGLSEKQIARGNFYLRPNDRYTKRQQDLLDMDEDNGSEDSWTYCKDESIS